MSVLKSPLHIHYPPNIKKEEPPQVLPRSQASQVSATRSLYFILLNFMCLVKQFLQFSIVYADVIYHIPLFCNGNGFSVSFPTTGNRTLAAMCGIPQSSVARIESCKTTPNLGTLLNIFQHLGLRLTVSPTKPTI